jgi:syntaxin 1B/2/3
MADYHQHGGNPYGTSAQPSHQAYTTASPNPLPITTLSHTDFLARVDGVKNDIAHLSTNISTIATLHQRSLSSPHTTSSLNSLITDTQVLSTRIKDQIRTLETDAARSNNNPTKNSQVRALKSHFREQLEQYRQEEVLYKKRYEEQIARQYRIVHPEAGEEEVKEAVQADWGDKGVFQTAVRTSTATHIKNSPS